MRGAEQRAFRYDPELGLSPSRRRLGDEAELITRVFAAGAVGYWVPAARVEHCIGHERQTIDYIMKYFAGAGETSAVQYGSQGAPLVFGVPRWIWRRLITGWLGYQAHRWISPAPVWVSYLINYAKACGAIGYWWNEQR